MIEKKHNIIDKVVIILLLISSIGNCFSQNIGINSTGATPAASSILDISSTNKGFLLPRVALTGTTDITTIVAPAATSLLVYNTATVSDVTPGYYYWTGSLWLRLVTSVPASAHWAKLGNASTVAATNFIGNIDNVDLTFRTNNIERMRLKGGALEFLNNGQSVYVGDGAGANMGTGSNYGNVAVGYQALNLGTTASKAIAIGYQALYNFNGSNSIGIGQFSQFNNTSGVSNISVGTYSMFNTTGGYNISLGDSSLFTNTSGTYNIAVGEGALRSGAAPRSNIALGRYALRNATGLGYNIALGLNAGANISSGSQNIAIGNYSLLLNTTSSNNVAIGYETGYTANTGNNVLIGNYAGRSIAGSGNVCIGYTAGQNEAGSNKLYIDNSNTATPLIYGDFSSDRVGINMVPTTNCLEVSGTASKTTASAWLANSDRRIKTDIQDIENAVQTIMKLRPVKFKYTKEWKDRNSYLKEHDHYYYNFIAQEYKEVFPESVTGSGKYLQGDSIEILQVDTYNAQIFAVKAIQEQQHMIENIKKDIDNQQKKINAQQQIIDVNEQSLSLLGKKE